MSAALATTDAAKDPAPRDQALGRLLGLVRKLVDYGRDLAATLRDRNVPDPPLAIARRFGGAALVLIIARITRGLMIAAALEKRLLHPRPHASGEPRQATPRQSSPRAPRAPRTPRPDEEEELRGQLPSAAVIAARVRKQGIGAVLVDICRDLGITPEHKLWAEVNEAIIRFGGNTVKLMNIRWRRSEQAIDLPVPPEIDARFERLMAAYARPP